MKDRLVRRNEVKSTSMRRALVPGIVALSLAPDVDRVRDLIRSGALEDLSS